MAQRGRPKTRQPGTRAAQALHEYVVGTLGMSLSHFAESVLGIDKSRLWKLYENQNPNPTLNTMRRIQDLTEGEVRIGLWALPPRNK